MIPPPNASVKPGAMMVKSVHTDATNVAVSTSGNLYSSALRTQVNGVKSFSQVHEMVILAFFSLLEFFMLNLIHFLVFFPRLFGFILSEPTRLCLGCDDSKNHG
jgi:hypothetical protein